MSAPTADWQNYVFTPSWGFSTGVCCSLRRIDKLGVTGSSPVPPLGKGPQTRAFRFSTWQRESGRARKMLAPTCVRAGWAAMRPPGVRPLLRRAERGPGGFPRGSRARRGDVRAAALFLLAEGPLNGYQIMQEIEKRSDGVWRPSPGSVYPALAQTLVPELRRLRRTAPPAALAPAVSCRSTTPQSGARRAARPQRTRRDTGSSSR
jgi:Transcriptional regulator PadR-like family